LAILKANSELNAVVFDRPQIIETARDFWSSKQDKDVLNRMKFIGGDILDSLPCAISDEDVYFFMAVFHTFSDEDCKRIFFNLQQAIESYSPHIIVADAVAEESNINEITASMDMQMLIGSEGRERTLGEWSNIISDTGFNIIQVIDMRALGKYIVIQQQQYTNT
jgi:hypothetical protein